MHNFSDTTLVQDAFVWFTMGEGPWTTTSTGSYVENTAQQRLKETFSEVQGVQWVRNMEVRMRSDNYVLQLWSCAIWH